MRNRSSVIALLALTACRYDIPPTGPPTVTTTVTTTVGQNPTPAPTPTPTTGGPTGGTRVPDSTTPLPLPSYGAQVLQAYATSSEGKKALAETCPASGAPSWVFIDGLVDLLRQRDTRWGYTCQRGDCNSVARDVIAYHAASGPDLTGAAGVINVDVVQDYCGYKPVAQWSPFEYEPQGLWSSRGRF